MTNPGFLFLGLFLLGAINVRSQNANRPVPKAIAPYTFVQYDTSYSGYFLTTPFRIGALAPNIPKPVLILDANGYLVWYALVPSVTVSDFKYHPQEQVYSYIKFKNPDNVQFVLLDKDFQLLDSFTTVNGISPDAHDFQISPNHTYLLSGASDSIMDLHAYLFGNQIGDTATHVTGFVVQEFDEDHNLLAQWNSNDYIHPSQAYAQYGYSPANFDYCHGNAIEVDTDGHWLLSFRHLNAIYKIDRNTGHVLWKLGGKSSSFTFPNDPGFSGQHDIRRLPNGNISLFDNANMAAPLKVSRAVEYQLDTLNWTATKVWEYRYAPGFFSPAMGNHQTTADRHHLVHYGLNYRPTPTAVLVDDAGEKMAEMFFQDSFMSYRSFLADLPLDHVSRPVIHCEQAGGLVTLSAPQGFERYAWSTGENLGGITVQAPGTYQVWVNHGTGMLGSEPFVISDINQACVVSGTEDIGPEVQQPVLEYYDLLGRKMTAPTPGQPYLVWDKRGRAKLKFRVE